MRVLHVSDFHLNERWFAWLVDRAPACDLICYTGDFLDLFSRVPISDQVRHVTRWLADLEQPLLFCSGNHDLEEVGSCDGAWLREVLPLSCGGDGDVWHIGGFTVQSCGWGVACQLARPVDVFLHHAPPAGCTTAISGTDGRDVGDFNLGEDLRAGLFPAGIILSGHQHTPQRWHDRCGAISVNPGVNPGARVPNFILVDLPRKRAQWFVDGRLTDAQEWSDQRARTTLIAGCRHRR